MNRDARVRSRAFVRPLLLDYTSSDYALLERDSLIKNLRRELLDGRIARVADKETYIN